MWNNNSASMHDSACSKATVYVSLAHRLLRCTEARMALGRLLACILAILLLMVAQTEAACPVGSYPWVDQWGTQICKRFDSGSTSTIEGTLDRCPVGSYPWVDSWGNRICRSFGGGGDAYDTSRGCPTGFYPWVDAWGNRTCKAF